jgi:hypothetical protein
MRLWKLLLKLAPPVTVLIGAFGYATSVMTRPILSAQHNSLVLFLFSIAFMTTAGALGYSMLNQRADERLRTAVAWLDDAAEARSRRDRSWHLEQTQPQRIIYSTMYNTAPDQPQQSRRTGRREPKEPHQSTLTPDALTTWNAPSADDLREMYNRKDGETSGDITKGLA